MKGKTKWRIVARLLARFLVPALLGAGATVLGVPPHVAQSLQVAVEATLSGS